MTPKSLLRHKLAVSKLSDMGGGTSFHRVLWDDDRTLEDDAIKRVVMCSGKVYFDLLEERARRGLRDVYLMRLEQLYPFPQKALTNELGRFAAAEMVWCQEEPQNMGAWTFAAPRIETVLEKINARHKRPRYAGRAEAASPATGSFSRHTKEQNKLVDEALTID